MTLSPAVMARMAQPDFWPRFFFWDEAWDEDPDDDGTIQPPWLRVRCDLGAGYAVVLSFIVEYTLYDLALEAPDLREPVTIGDNNDAHPFAYTMTWDELDLIARAVAVRDPSLAHPGLVVALLAQFTILQADDHLAMIEHTLDAAFHRARPSRSPGPRPETHYFAEAVLDEPLEWATTPSGHRYIATDLDTLRVPADTPDEAGFPFAAWDGALAQARKVLDLSRGR